MQQYNSYDGATSNVEMRSLGQTPPTSFGPANPGNSLKVYMDECESIRFYVDNEINGRLKDLKIAQRRVLNEVDTSSGTSSKQALEQESASIMSSFRDLTLRVRKVRSAPQGRAGALAFHAEEAKKKVELALNAYRKQEKEYSDDMQAQMVRQYLIVRPNATEEDIAAIVENASGPSAIFEQSLMNGNRLGEANSTLNRVRQRQAELEKIERTMAELARLFNDMAILVEQQSAQVAEVEKTVVQTNDNLVEVVSETGQAVTSAVSRRKKKWICLAICVAIVVVIAAAVGIYIAVNRAASGAGGNKRNVQRSVSDDVVMHTARAVGFSSEPPVARVYAQSKIVVPSSGRTHRLALKRHLNSRRYMLPDDLTGESDTSVEK
ncbi:t-SNARE [Lasiosphaeria miniovina]|uniref:t-SNARE n=1 Tax=Lasiosphaeria miniovina TaxID=1954250 RepID=A0AA40ADF2_9PEZI|nr:t-SNARE [Lasiosphaeria miniovina]KAK0713877.1 t-SNARE [Lasiosphaeria miniovina]